MHVILKIDARYIFFADHHLGTRVFYPIIPFYAIVSLAVTIWFVIFLFLYLNRFMLIE